MGERDKGGTQMTPPVVHKKQGKFSTYGQVRSRLATLKKEGDTPYDTLAQELIDYYYTPQGRRDIARSPHFDKEPEEIVGLLLRES